MGPTMFPFSTLRGHPEPGTFQPGTRTPIPVPGNRKPGAPGNPESAHEQHIRPATRGSTNERPKRSLTRMASRLRPTPETGTVAATKMPASSIGPSWAQRGSREARLAFRQAQKRGDREGAMRIAGEADKQGLASQASIGSAEERLAGEYQGRGADTAVTAEIETALTPPGLSRDMIDTPAGPRRSAQQYSSQTSATQPSIPEQPPAPGASQPPENPVSGSSTPVTGDPESRLGMRRGSFALQGLAGRQALSENLRKSIAAGGGDLSGDRLKRAKAEADRLGVTPEQFLSELQDIGVSVPGEDMKTLMPKDNRSLDQRLRDYQDKYLGGGPASEMPARLRADAATNRTAAESMRRARPAPAPASAPAPAPAPVSPTPAPTPILIRPPGIPQVSSARRLGQDVRGAVGSALAPVVAAERAVSAEIGKATAPARMAVLGAQAGVANVAEAARVPGKAARTTGRVISTGFSVAAEKARRKAAAAREFIGGLTGNPQR